MYARTVQGRTLNFAVSGLLWENSLVMVDDATESLWSHLLGEAMQVFTALKRQGIPAKLLYFPDENHFVQKPLNAELWWATVHEWIGEWVQ